LGGPALQITLKATTKGLRQDCNHLNHALVERYLSYLAMQGASPNTLRTYANGLRNFLRFLRDQSILTVEHADLLLYLSGLYRRGLIKSSAANHVYAFRSFCKFCALVGLQCSSAFQLLRLPKLPKRLTEFHPLPEIERLIAATRTPLELALIELGFGTGCRISELQRMRIDDIGWQDRSIRVLGKGSKERMVFFGEPAEKALKKLLRGRSEGFLFVSLRGQSNPRVTKCKYAGALRWRTYWSEYDATTGKLIHRYRWLGNTNTVTVAEARRRLNRLLKNVNLTRPTASRPLGCRHLHKIIVQIGRRAGLKTWPHRLRHSFATAMVNDGAGLREVQQLLGHSSLSTTSRYLHTTTNELKGTHELFHPREEHSNAKEKI
jgi:site-specific recombinase XerD